MANFNDDPLGLGPIEGGKAGGGVAPGPGTGFNPDPLNLGPIEEEPSYLEAAKVGLKSGLAGAAKMYEIPVRGFEKLTGVRPPVYPSEYLEPTQEEQQRVAQLGIPGQVVAGVAGLPGAVAKYGPLMAVAPAGIVGAGLTLGGVKAAEEALAGKPIPEIGRAAAEEAVLGGIFRGIEPLGKLAKSAILGGTFGTQAAVDTYIQTQDINESLKAGIAPSIIGAGLGLLQRTPKKPPTPPPLLQIPYRPGGVPAPFRPRRVWEPPPEGPEPTKMYQDEKGIWRAYPSAEEFEGPTEEIPYKIPKRRPEFVKPKKGEKQAWMPPGYEFIPRGTEPVGPQPFVSPPVPEWIKEGRTQPPPEYPPVPFTGKPTMPPPPPAPPAVPGLPPPPAEIIPGFSNDRLNALLDQSQAIGGMISKALIKRVSNLGTKRADDLLKKLEAAGYVEVDPTTKQMRLTDKVPKPGERLRYRGEIYELRELVAQGEPGLKKGTEEGGTISWGSSYPPFMANKGWTKEDVLKAIDMGMAGHKFEGVPNKKGVTPYSTLKQIWEATKVEARGMFRARIQEERVRRREALRSALEADQKIQKPENISELTRESENESMELQEALREEGYSEQEIQSVIGETESNYADEAPPSELAEKELFDFFSAAPEPIGPQLSPVAKAQYKLLRIGIPFPQEKIPGGRVTGPLFEGYPPEQPGLFGRPPAPPSPPSAGPAAPSPAAGPVPSFTPDALQFVKPEYISPDAEDTNLYHVTTAKDKVLAEGLKARKETKTQGLGGGIDNQASDRVSVTFDAAHAQNIADTLRLAVRAARGEINPKEVLDEFITKANLLDDTPEEISRILKAPEDVYADWDAFDQWFGKEYDKDSAYDLLQELDDALPQVFQDAEFPSGRVGLTADKKQLAKIDPNQIDIIQVEAKVGARPDHIADEMELRFKPEDIRIVKAEAPALAPAPEAKPARDLEPEEFVGETEIGIAEKEMALPSGEKIMVDASLHTPIFKLNEAGYETFSACSGLKSEHLPPPGGGEVDPGFIGFSGGDLKKIAKIGEELGFGVETEQAGKVALRMPMGLSDEPKMALWNELTNRLTKKPEAKPELSPVAKGQYKLPGVKIGVEFGKREEPPEGEKPALIEAAEKAVAEKAQPRLPLAPTEKPVPVEGQPIIDGVIFRGLNPAYDPENPLTGRYVVDIVTPDGGATTAYINDITTGGLEAKKIEVANKFKALPGPDPVINADDINLKLAESAHSGTSWVPEQRAKGEQRAFVDEMTAVWNKLKALAKTPEQLDLAREEFDRYKAEWVKRYSEVLGSRSRLVSTFIAGPSKFPSRMMNKRNEAYDKKVADFLAWDAKVQNSIMNKIRPKFISADREDAVPVLQGKLDNAKKMQDVMKKANEIIRKKTDDATKIAALTKLGLSETTAQKLLKPDFMGRIGFPSYELQNNLANIKRMEARVGSLTREKGKAPVSATFEGGRVEENEELNRIQIFFDEKPDAAMIKTLKSNGFHWSPKEGAWQRMKNANTRAAVQRILKVDLTAPKEAPPAEGVPVEAGEPVKFNIQEYKEDAVKPVVKGEPSSMEVLERAEQIQAGDSSIDRGDAIEQAKNDLSPVVPPEKLEDIQKAVAGDQAAADRLFPKLSAAEQKIYDQGYRDAKRGLKRNPRPGEEELYNKGYDQNKLDTLQAFGGGKKPTPPERPPYIENGLIRTTIIDGEPIYGGGPGTHTGDVLGKYGQIPDKNVERGWTVVSEWDPSNPKKGFLTNEEAAKWIDQKVKDSTPPEPSVAEEAAPKPQKVGWVYLRKGGREQWKPFTDSEEITRGKQKGKVRVTLSDGTKVVVDKSDIKPEGGKGEFRTGPAPEEPLTREAVDGFARAKLKDYPNAPEVEIIDQADIPDRLLQGLNENLRKGIKGIYDPLNKKIYLIRDMLGNEADILSTIEHEAVGHFGMEAILGKGSDTFFNRVYMKYGRKGLQGIADERGYDLSTKEGQLKAAREYVARMAETGENPGLLKQFYAWVREQIRKLSGDRVFKKVSDSEIQTMLKRSREFLESDSDLAWKQKVEYLKSEIRGIAAEPMLSVKETAKTIGKTGYEQELKPRMERAKASWKWLKNALAPTVGVQMKALNVLSRMLGDREKFLARVEIKTEQAAKELSKLSRQEQIDFVDRIQNGDIYNLPPNLKAIERLHRQIEDDLWTSANIILKHMDEPERIAYLEDHVRNFWKVLPKGTIEEINRRGFSGLGRRPLEGTKASLHHQYWTLKEGIAAGGEPFTTNLMEMTRLNYADTMKLITARRMWDALLDIGHRVFIKWGEQVPEGFIPVDDKIANRYFPKAPPKVKVMTPEGIKTMSEYEANLRRTAMSDPDPAARAEAAVSLNKWAQGWRPKEFAAGRWVVEENAARLLNNYLSKDNVRTNPFFNSIMGLKNVTTALELGFSAFHASFITWEAVASQLELGMRKIWNQGMIMEGLKDMLEAPISVGTTYKIGRNVLRYFKDPEGFARTTQGQKFLAKFPEAAEAMDHLFWGGGSVRMNEAYKISSLNVFRENLHSMNYIGAAGRSIPALSQWIMKPLFENYIPAMKRAVFFKEFSNEVMARQRDITLGKITKAEIARDIWHFVENRFGEMNFDNLWWNRTMKSGLQLAVRSVTWKFGNIRGYGKALTGQSAELLAAAKEGRMPRLTREMAWVWGLGIVTAGMASITQYAFTGKYPESWKDLVYPQIDNAGGRISLPTYMRDIFHMAHAPVKYVTSSLASYLSRFYEVITNKDFYGVRVHDPNENAVFQRVDDAIHMMPLPFSISSFKRMREEGETPFKQTLGFVGGTKAPYWIERTDAELKAGELKAGHLPVAGRTPADFERGRLLKMYARQYQQASLKGEETGRIMGALQNDIRAGKLYLSDMLRFRERIRSEPLVSSVEHLPFKDVMEVWRVATKEEKDKLYPILMRKFAGLRNMEDRVLYFPKVRELKAEFQGG